MIICDVPNSLLSFYVIAILWLKTTVLVLKSLLGIYVIAIIFFPFANSMTT